MAELLWPSNNKERERERERERKRRRQKTRRWRKTGQSRQFETLSLSPFSLSLSHSLSPSSPPGGHFKKSSNHLPFSISLSFLRTKDVSWVPFVSPADPDRPRPVPDSEPDPGIRVPLLHWTRAEKHAGGNMVQNGIKLVFTLSVRSVKPWKYFNFPITFDNFYCLSTLMVA